MHASSKILQFLCVDVKANPGTTSSVVVLESGSDLVARVSTHQTMLLTIIVTNTQNKYTGMTMCNRQCECLCACHPK